MYVLYVFVSSGDSPFCSQSLPLPSYVILFRVIWPDEVAWKGDETSPLNKV